MSAADERLRDMGSTLVALLVCHDGCAVLSVGDSRAYGYEDGAVTLLTKDDTEAQRLLDLGLLSAEDTVALAGKDRLLRYIGKCQPGLVFRARELTMGPGSRDVLLCSDGVAKSLGDAALASLLRGVGGTMILA
jgi:serine/threonine protein phosphatase PrpC